MQYTQIPKATNRHGNEIYFIFIRGAQEWNRATKHCVILLNIENSIYIDYFIEKPPFETLIFKYDESTFKAGNGEGKEGLYKESDVPHWSIDNPIIRANRKFD